jgi:trimethyllysine dioxygenase
MIPGGFYDFTADLTMKDTAYTTLALGPHTDTTYFTDPAGLQMFHLLSHTAGTGGASLLVDGFKAARSMFQRFQPKFHVLAKTPIPWHASGNEGITITPTKPMPVFTLSDPDGICSQKMVQVRWNNDDRGVVENRSIAGSTSKKDTDSKYWYDAARTWDQILKDEKEQYWAQLEPGRPLSMLSFRLIWEEWC